MKTRTTKGESVKAWRRKLAELDAAHKRKEEEVRVTALGVVNTAVEDFRFLWCALERAKQVGPYSTEEMALLQQEITRIIRPLQAWAAGAKVV